MTPTTLDIDAALDAARKVLARRSSKEEIADAKRLAKVIASEQFGGDGDTEDHRKAELIAAAIVVARAMPPNFTAAQVQGVLVGCAGRYTESLGEVVQFAISQAALMPPLIPTKRPRANAGPTDPVPGEFEVEVSGKDVGKPVRDSQHNLDTALARLGVRTRFNEFSGQYLIERGGKSEVRQDHHVETLMEDMISAFRFETTESRVRRFLNDTARRNSFHPVRDYLDSLPPWDGVPRVERWLIDAGAQDTPYVRAVSRLVLVAAVRRIKRTGCKFDEMLVIETPEQGKGKSSALRALVPDEAWFTDDFSFAYVDDSKKMLEMSEGRWIVEAGELTGMSGKEVSAIKQYLSRREDTARKAFGRDVTRVPRHFVVIATVNEEQYLRDRKNRRFWSVRVVEFNPLAIAAARDQIWAEAVQLDLEHPEESYIRLDPSLYAAAEAEQDKRRMDEPFEIVLEELLGELNGRVKIQDLWRPLGFTEKPPSPGEQTKIAAAMHLLKFEKKRLVTADDKRVHYYVRGTGAEADRDIVIQQAAGGFRAGVSPAPGQPLVGSQLRLGTPSN